MKYVFALSCGVFFYCVVYMCLSMRFSKKIVLEQRLRNTAKLNHPNTKDEELDTPFSERMLKPVLNRLLNLFSMFIPQNSAAQDKLTQQLMLAGIRMSAQNYSAAVLLFTVTCVIVFALYGQIMSHSILTFVLFGLLGLGTGLVMSRFHLKSKITGRQNEIYHQLPDTLDLLSVSVSAGLGFDQALAYVVKKSQGALIRELDTAQREISLGRSRKEALERLADRCDSLEIHTFVSAVLQADEMGSSMQNILQIQASAIREAHKQNVEEKAQKLSVKMLIPLVLFIFPVMFIVLLGPAVPSVIEALGGN
ncbi:Bacterial type II secretion system protein F domain protein [Pelotomaculum sp. FP]|uniref:type II secretion system F family protein n=1 Tax=Pelotomaculum sp. FP TaxID=261474 RepID=UPI0010651D1D|nr:type II secretion system F family protein [Pelotomaculum sp. FP]TEB12136.1 Bacterial type II secretion system protein F domain protein [Pelotomaculum sp. FP]